MIRMVDFIFTKEYPMRLKVLALTALIVCIFAIVPAFAL